MEKALQDFKETHKGDFTLTYFKGLGEASPEELGMMIMRPETRNIQQVTIEDAKAVTKIINDLMGKNSTPKKEFVFGNVEV
jgi:DNA gyrase subunit B